MVKLIMVLDLIEINLMVALLSHIVPVPLSYIFSNII